MIEDDMIELYHIDIDWYGRIFYTKDPLEMLVDEVHVDTSHVNAGFVYDIACNYPEAKLDGEVRLRK